MVTELKPVIAMAESFDLLDIRVGKILTVEEAANTLKPSYKLTADFGRFGVKTSVARLTMQSRNELQGRQILGVLNLGSRDIGGTISEFLCLGVQLSGAENGEATIVSPLKEVKLGSKLF